jgi:hypothetical protein
MVIMIGSNSQKDKTMKKGLTKLTQKRLAQFTPEKTTVYVAWLDTHNDSGWGWGLEEDNLDFITYDTSDRYDPELENMTAGYQVHDPKATDEELKGYVKEDENFPTELKGKVVFDIDRNGAPDEHPYDNEEGDVDSDDDEGYW